MNKHAQLLGDLLTKARERGSLGGELPYLEFKRNIGDSQSRHGFSISYEKLGEYISGLANAACLHDQSYAYLILGVEDASWKIVGTNFYPATDSYRNQNFQRWLFSKFKAQCAFDIFEVDAEGKHVVIFQIPAASGLPVSYQDKRWIRIASSLCDLADYPDLERRIYQSNSDWSAHIIPEAQLSDLDEVAIAKGRALYAEKNPHLREALESWDDATFLNKAKVTTQGKITRTALLLFGKEESCTLLSPYVGELRWILRNAQGDARDYLIKSCPFILSIDEIYNRIRNLKYRYINSSKRTLFPEEVDTYDAYVIREAIHNAVAHQDYLERAKINIIEYDDYLVFENRGQFIPSTIQEVLKNDAPESKYRNTHLVQAMRELKMVDTIGSGIRKMFITQRERLFPMPDYEIDANQGSVQVRIIGKVLDETYTSLLMEHTDLPIVDMEMLNRVYFKKALTADEIKYLRKKKLIAGKGSNIYIAKAIAQATGHAMEFTKNEGLDNDFYKSLILKALKDHGQIKRASFEELLLDKLPDALNKEQKKSKVGNLLSDLRIAEKITYKKNKGWALKN